MASKKSRPRALPRGFTRSLSERCGDCEYRGALDNVGRPRKSRSGLRATYGCETCGGKGRIGIPVGARTDPYFTGRY